MAIYTVNISKRIINWRGEDSYKHHFRIETDKIPLEEYEDNLVDIVKELRTIYKEPDYLIEVWSNSTTVTPLEI